MKYLTTPASNKFFFLMFDLELEEIGYDANVREGDDEGGGEERELLQD